MIPSWAQIPFTRGQRLLTLLSCIGGVGLSGHALWMAWNNREFSEVHQDALAVVFATNLMVAAVVAPSCWRRQPIAPVG